MTKNAKSAEPVKRRLRCRTSGRLTEWLSQSGGSLAITTYTSGKLVLVSSFEGRLHFRSKHFVRPMGIAFADGQLALAVRREILLFRQSAVDADQFALRQRYETGKVDAHDVGFGERGIYFANTRFNCVARPSLKKRFVRAWQPIFIGEGNGGLVRGDRCHLNGLGMRHGQPELATAFCATGHANGWREQDRFTGGVLIDMRSDEIVVEGLCMPHSPRWHDGRWWLCNSGHGLLSSVDVATGDLTEVCELPGFTRGLSFIGDHALVGLSQIRSKHILDAPPVRERHRKLFSGIALVNWKTGQHVGSLEFLDGGREVFDVIFLPGIKRPSLPAR